MQAIVPKKCVFSCVDSFPFSVETQPELLMMTLVIMMKKGFSRFFLNFLVRNFTSFCKYSVNTGSVWMLFIFQWLSVREQKLSLMQSLGYAINIV